MLYKAHKSHQLIAFTGDQDLFDKYETLEKIGFDYAVEEKRLCDLPVNRRIWKFRYFVLCMGLKDVIVLASAEDILVSDKEQSSHIKLFADKVYQQIMFTEKFWGTFRALDVEDESLTIKVSLNADQRMNYPSHQYRDEGWSESLTMRLLRLYLSYVVKVSEGRSWKQFFANREDTCE